MLINIETGIWVESVAALLADTDMTYTAGQIGTVTAGQIIRERERGFAYRVESLIYTGIAVQTANPVQPVRLSVIDDQMGRLNVLALGVTEAADCTALIQAALDGHPNVFVPTGEYISSAMFHVRDYCQFEGSGKWQTIFINNVSDGVGRKASASTWQYFTIRGMGFRKTANTAHRTRAFNFTDCSWMRAHDLSVKNFYVGLFWARKQVSAGGVNSCWYNKAWDIDFDDVANDHWIDNTQFEGADLTLSINSCNGIKVFNVTSRVKTYDWHKAGLHTSNFRYHGYGHIYTEFYSQGKGRKVWREQVGGNNTISHGYFESNVIPGNWFYAPLEYQGNQDWVDNVHFDPIGPDQYSAIYDPQNVFIWRGEKNTKPVQAGSFKGGKEQIPSGSFATDTAGWTFIGNTPTIEPNGTGNWLKIERSAAGGADRSEFIIKTVPNKVNRLTFKFQKGTAPGRLYLGTAPLGQQYIPLTVLADAVLTEREYLFIPTTTSTYLTFQVNAAVPGNIYIKDVSCKAMALSVVDGDAAFQGKAIFNGGMRVKFPVYPNNAAAILGGLEPEDVYRTGADPDLLAVVH